VNLVEMMVSIVLVRIAVFSHALLQVQQPIFQGRYTWPAFRIAERFTPYIG
jgi:hypothetical protein